MMYYHVLLLSGRNICLMFVHYRRRTSSWNCMLYSRSCRKWLNFIPSQMRMFLSWSSNSTTFQSICYTQGCRYGLFRRWVQDLQLDTISCLRLLKLERGSVQWLSSVSWFLLGLADKRYRSRVMELLPASTQIQLRKLMNILISFLKAGTSLRFACGEVFCFTMPKRVLHIFRKFTPRLFSTTLLLTFYICICNLIAYRSDHSQWPTGRAIWICTLAILWVDTFRALQFLTSYHLTVTGPRYFTGVCVKKRWWTECTQFEWLPSHWPNTAISPKHSGLCFISLQVSRILISCFHSILPSLLISYQDVASRLHCDK